MHSIFAKEVTFKWYLFVPVFLLFFSYVFGVAVELLGGYQLLVRVSALAFCVVCSVLLRVSFSFQSCLLLVFFLIYTFALYTFNGGSVVLNFIYLAFILFYFYSLGVNREDLLFHLVIATYSVVFLYFIYLMVGGVSFEPVTIGERTRYYFGFTNPNKVGIVAYSLILLSVLFFIGRNRVLPLLICVPFVVIALYSGSRTAVYALILFVGMAVFSYFFSFRRIICFVPVIFLMGSFYVATLSENSVVNFILSNRPIDYYAFVSSLDVYDFILGASSDGYRVDNSFILAYFAVGPLGILLFFVLMLRLPRNYFTGLELSFMFSIMAYGLMEGILVRVEFPIVIYFYYSIIGRGEIMFRPKSFWNWFCVAVRRPL